MGRKEGARGERKREGAGGEHLSCRGRTGRSGAPTPSAGKPARHAPLYSMPHLSLTATCLPVRDCRKPLGMSVAEGTLREAIVVAGPVARVARERVAHEEGVGSE